MNWFPLLHRRPDETADERPWTPEEVAVLAEAVRRAPSVHNTQPWSLRARGRSVTLFMHPTPELIQHDPDGRDRRMSCGAAVANLLIAMRGLGWATEVRWQPGEGPAMGEATVTGVRRLPATALDKERRRAITARVSYRRPFTGRPVPHLARYAIASASTARATWVSGPEEEHSLAGLLAYAAHANHADDSYQRELGVWISSDAESGLSAEVLSDGGVAAIGLATDRTRLPGQDQIARWLAWEQVLVLSTLTDEPRDHLLAGEALERSWLEATRLGLAASVMTQPLRLQEVRHGLRDALGLAGVPQLLMRIGHPSSVPVPRTERRPLPEVFMD